MKKTAIAAAFLMLGCGYAFPWGQKGHDVTAAIAESYLTPEAKAAVDALLDGKSIVYWANWLDNASHTPQYDYTKTWHYKNIDAGMAYEEVPLLETGTIITALNEQTAILADPTLPQEDRTLALKIVVHLMGDLHQPMHMGRSTDKGGNRHTVKYFGKNANLHGIWDSSVPESAHKWSYTEWVDQINRVSDAEVAEIQEGSFDDWGRQTYLIAQSVYENTPEGTDVSYDYVADWTPTVEQQLLRAGLRLAKVLNNAFKE